MNALRDQGHRQEGGWRETPAPGTAPPPRQRRSVWALVACGWLWTAGLSAVAADAALPPWNELEAIVRSNLTGRSAAELDQALVRGLLDQLRGEVLLESTETNAATTGPALARADLHEETLAYLRVARVEPGLATQAGEALDRLTGTNRLEGVILDLRFATGFDYEAAAAVADRFVGRDTPLLDWGGQVVRAQPQTNDLDIPVAVLINADTAGAPEALAAALREARVALLLGSTTAGQAHVFREVTLSTGQRLRLAAAKVRLGNGDAMPPEGVKPDIEVALSRDEEKSYWEDPWRALARGASPSSNPSAAGTNASPRRINEAELMRLRREELGGRETDAERPRPVRPAKPILQDPVLARAVDLLRGLAIVRQAKPR